MFNWFSVYRNDSRFENFTDTALNVFEGARVEARRLNHPYIGAEHLLLGLIVEDPTERTGVGTKTLLTMGIDIESTRTLLLELMQSGPQFPIAREFPFTQEADKVIDTAIEEAMALNQGYVGTEHILLGLLSLNEGPAAQVLLSLGLRHADVRTTIIKFLGLRIV